MGVTYERIKRNDPAVTICNRMVEKYHGALKDAEVSIDLVWARGPKDANGETCGPAVKLHGYPCAAVVRVINLKDRAKGAGDAEIVIDGDRWAEWSESEQEALIDHELTHIELVTDAEGSLKRDDLDRPKLRMRKHDRQFGWFDSCAERHGQAAFEVQQAVEFVTAHHQLYLPGIEVGV